MIVGVDASKLTESQRTGIGNTVVPIISELKKIDSKNRYILYSRKPLPKEFLGNNFTESIIPFFKFWHLVKLPLALLKEKPDAFLEISNELPFFAPKKSICVLHDFAYKYFPECYSPTERVIQNRTAKRAVNKAKKIIVSSVANKKDLIKFYNCPEDKIAVIPFGLGNSSKNVEAVEEVKIINSPFFLSVGRFEKRKNTLNIIKAFNKFKNETKSSSKLVLVGKPGYGFREINKEINNSPFKSDIIKLGFVSDGNLNYLYAKALALVYPSLYEGYGFPILEAMKQGIPVLTSNVPTIKEVANDAAIYVNPTNVEEIWEAMLKLYKEANLRASLITKGKENIKRFSWEKTAKQIMDLINE